MVRKSRLQHACFKTRMCKFALAGSCTKSNCAFAHAEQELLPPPDLRRTKKCPFLRDNGFCANLECPFSHQREELRRVRFKLLYAGGHEQGQCEVGRDARPLECDQGGAESPTLECDQGSAESAGNSSSEANLPSGGGGVENFGRSSAAILSKGLGKTGGTEGSKDGDACSNAYDVQDLLPPTELPLPRLLMQRWGPPIGRLCITVDEDSRDSHHRGHDKAEEGFETQGGAEACGSKGSMTKSESSAAVLLARLLSNSDTDPSATTDPSDDDPLSSQRPDSESGGLDAGQSWPSLQAALLMTSFDITGDGLYEF